MSRNEDEKRIAYIVSTAETFFSQKVRKVSAPGGLGRSSYRLFLPGRSVIGTFRPNFRRTHLEAFVLNSISRECGDTPVCLGVAGEIMFQSDVGNRRLNQEISRHRSTIQEDLAYQAIAAIFRIQAAARQTSLHEKLPHLGHNKNWITNFTSSVNALAPYSKGRGREIDQEALSERIATPGRQFVKWDCRSGNAAIGKDERLRWFDFEYSGLRHGAEDLAWLIGDETWPLAPETMLRIVIDCFDPGCGYELDAYLDYLSLYLSLHSLQRFKLILKQVAKRGWLSRKRVRKFDDAGLHPEFAAQICRVGQFFAARNKLTAPLAYDFEDASLEFDAILGKRPAKFEGEKRAKLSAKTGSNLEVS